MSPSRLRVFRSNIYSGWSVGEGGTGEAISWLSANVTSRNSSFVTIRHPLESIDRSFAELAIAQPWIRRSANLHLPRRSQQRTDGELALDLLLRSSRGAWRLRPYLHLPRLLLALRLLFALSTSVIH